MAELRDGMVVALDTDQVALRRLAKKLRQKGLWTRVKLLNCQIEKAPFDKQAFDVVWAEGSISHLGFKAALELLGQYLKTGGFLALHDEAANCLEKIHTVESLGFSLVGFFLLSESVWWDEYYGPLQSVVAKTDSAQPPYDLSDILNQRYLPPSRVRNLRTRGCTEC